MPRTRWLAGVLLVALLVVGCTGGAEDERGEGTPVPTELATIPSAPGATIELLASQFEEVTALDLTSGTFKHLEPTGRLEAVFRSDSGSKLIILGPRPPETEGFTVAIELGTDVLPEDRGNRRFLANGGECDVTLQSSTEEISGTVACGRVGGMRGSFLTAATGSFRARAAGDG